MTAPLTANRDFGRLGTFLVMVLAVLAGVGVASFVAWEAVGHKRLELAVLGPAVPSWTACRTC